MEPGAASAADRDARDAVVTNNEAALRDAIGRGADVNHVWHRHSDDPSRTGTLLFLAALDGNDHMCDVLLAEGADPNLGDSRSVTPLHLACEGSSATAISLVRRLLDAGADVNRGDIKGISPLDYACDVGNHRVVQFLISHGANVEVKDVYGLTPLQLALFYGYRQTVLTLLRAGAAVKVLRREDLRDETTDEDNRENSTLNDYMIDIVNDGGWHVRVQKHQTLLLGVVSRCVQLPPEIMQSIVSFWSLPH